MNTEAIDLDAGIDAFDSYIRSKNALNSYIKIVSPLLPLHLSLQAFFGISKDDEEKWWRIGKNENYKKRLGIDIRILEEKGIKEAQDIDNNFKDTFPNTESFLLAEEAEWDFYASKFDKFLPENKNNGMQEDCPATVIEREEYYPDKNIAKLLGNLLESKDNNGDNEWLEKLRDALNKDFSQTNIEGGAKFFKVNLKSGSKNVSYNEFVKCLRELCAILANTNLWKKKNGNIKEHIGYKGNNQKLIAEILENTKTSSGEVIENTPHSKLDEKAIGENYNYEILKNQISDWGIKKAMVVIAGIDRLASLME